MRTQSTLAKTNFITIEPQLVQEDAEALEH